MGRDQTACAGHGLEPCQYRSTRQSELGLQVACLLSLGSNITNETDFNSNNAKSRSDSVQAIASRLKLTELSTVPHVRGAAVCAATVNRSISGG